MSATHAVVLRETDSWSWGELKVLNLTDGSFHRETKFTALLFGDSGLQVLNFRDTLSHEGDDGHIGDSGDPGVAGQLEVQTGQTLWFLGIAGARGFPFQHTPGPIQQANGIDVGHEIIAIGQCSEDLLLRVLLWLGDLDSIILCELLQEMNPLSQHSFPVISLGIFQLGLAIGTPLLEQRGSRIFTVEERSQGLFKTTAKHHRGPGFLLSPAIQITVPIAPGAAEVMGDLRVAIGHGWPPRW